MKTFAQQAALDLLTKGWDGFFAGHGKALLEEALPGWLGKQRWFGAKTRVITTLSIAHWAELPASASSSLVEVLSRSPESTLRPLLMLVDLCYDDESHDRYQVPLDYASGESLTELAERAPGSVVATLTAPTGRVALYDAAASVEFRQELLHLVERESRLTVENSALASKHIAATLVAAHESRPAHEVGEEETEAIAGRIRAQHSIELDEVAPEFVGHMPGADAAGGVAESRPLKSVAEVRGVRSEAFGPVRGAGPLETRVSSAEQSNTNLVYGQQMLLKLFRRLQPGLNPDVEIGRFLTETAQFTRIAPYLGQLDLREGSGETTTLALLQGLVANEGDGWAWTLDELSKYFAAAEEGHASSYAEAAGLLGRRTAEMHLALATETTDVAFAAEALSADDLARESARIRMQIGSALDSLALRAGKLEGEAGAMARAALARRDELLRKAALTSAPNRNGQRIRIHGDYHLGQVLRTGDDFVILDFEGEPARSLAERRRKQSPLKDVAGMLRSFSYAASAGLQGAAESLRPLAKHWEEQAIAAFLSGYDEVARTKAGLLPEPAESKTLLDAYLLEKALYELQYELNNRPGWVAIPLAGILALS